MPSTPRHAARPRGTRVPSEGSEPQGGPQRRTTARRALAPSASTGSAGTRRKGHRSLIVLPELIAVCRRPGNDRIPSWATSGPLCSVTRSGNELSIVCAEKSVPEGERAERGWRAMRFADVLDFAEVGILASVSAPLAGAGVSLMALSTFDTDYLLVKQKDLKAAVKALRAAGYKIAQ